MSSENDYDFSKFVKDIEKRENISRENKRKYQESHKDHPMRKRNILYRELWQNRIVWKTK